MGTLKKDVLTELEERLLAAFAGRDDVQAVVTATVELIRDEHGSQTHYVQRYTKRKRRLKIVREWKEQRAQGFEDRIAIAKKFDVHRSTVDKAIARYLSEACRRDSDNPLW